jgi:transcriptional antiterminator RfaH
MRHWYLIYTKPRREAVAEANLKRQGFNTYLPWLAKPHPRGHTRTASVEPLFPRYLFVEVDTGEQSVAPIRSTFGVSRIVTFGGRLIPVAGDLIEALKQQTAADGLHRSLNPDFQHGDRINVVSGPFEGLKGIFNVPTGCDRVLILLDILGKTSTVSIGLQHVAPA